MMMRKTSKKKVFLWIWVIVALMLVQLHPIPAFGAAEVPVIDTETVSMIDSKSGAIPFNKEGEVKKKAGDFTKLMTAIVAAEAGDLTDVQKSQIKKMLYENDDNAGEALVKGISQDVAGFYKKMNEKAKALGCKNTNFVSVTGNTDSPENYTTTNDIAIIAREFLKEDALREMVTFDKKDKISYGMIYSSSEKSEIKTMAMVGIKDDTEFITVTMGGLTKEGNIVDHEMLLKYGFENYRTYQALSKKKSVGKVKIKGGQKSYVKVYPKEDLYVTLPKEAGDSLVDTELVLEENIKAPVAKGAVVGKIQALEAGDVTAEVQVIIMEDVGEGGPWSKIGISDLTMIYIAIGLCTVFLLTIIVKVRKKKKRKKIEQRKQARREKEAMRIARERAEKQKRDWPY